MATRTPKIPARSTLLNSSLDGMDDLFDFKTKEDLSQSEQETEILIYGTDDIYRERLL